MAGDTINVTGDNGNNNNSSNENNSSSNNTSSSSGSSAPSGPKYSPDVMRRMQLLQQMYISIWGEPATEEYLAQSAKAGLNQWEFAYQERVKPAYFLSPDYKKKEDSWATLLHQLGVA
jgi:hypothetical protein